MIPIDMEAPVHEPGRRPDTSVGANVAKNGDTARKNACATWCAEGTACRPYVALGGTRWSGRLTARGDRPQRRHGF